VIAQSHDEKCDWTLALLAASSGLLSAFIAMCLRYPLAHYVVSRGWGLSQMLVPGAVFGALLSGCFALQGYLRAVSFCPFGSHLELNSTLHC
jgi:hypothetical protein